jgi:hypothetical protein
MAGALSKQSIRRRHSALEVMRWLRVDAMAPATDVSVIVVFLMSTVEELLLALDVITASGADSAAG